MSRGNLKIFIVYFLPARKKSPIRRDSLMGISLVFGLFLASSNLQRRMMVVFLVFLDFVNGIHEITV